MDLSDGLALDLHRLCRASGVGARLLSTALPLDPAAQSWVGEKEARRLALHGGEDYRLLFAIPPSREKRLRRMVPSERLRPIGRLVSRREGIKLEDPEGRIEPLAPLGYDHLLDGRRAIRTHRH